MELNMVSSGHTDHRYLHVPLLQHEPHISTCALGHSPQTPKWFLVAVWLLVISMASGNSTAPQTSTWPPAAATAQTTDISAAIGCSTDHRNPRGPQQQHSSWTPTWVQAASQTMDPKMALSSSMARGQRHGLWWLTQLLAAVGPQTSTWLLAALT